MSAKKISKEIIISNTNGYYSFGNDMPVDLSILKIKDQQASTLVLKKCNISFFNDNSIDISNNEFSIIHSDITYNISISPQHVYDDTVFLLNIKNAINAVIPNNLFEVSKIDASMVISSFTRENLYTFCCYHIYTNDASVFKLLFKTKNSIGPILGFNVIDYGIHATKNPPLNSYVGTATIPVERYESIYIHNHANYATPLFDNSTDANCKMMLYDSDNTLIQNLVNPLDATISLKYNYPTDSSILIKKFGEYVKMIEDALNEHSNSFTPTANFEVKLSCETCKITIKNTTGAKFGIGFDLLNELNSSNNYGSMYKELGFDKITYTYNTSFTGSRPVQILRHMCLNDYLLFCSVDKFYDDTNNNISNIDYKTYSPSPLDNISNPYIIFTFPFYLNYSSSGYINDLRDLYSTNVSQYIMEKYNLDSTVFFMRTRSGRHMRITNWDFRFSIEY